MSAASATGTSSKARALGEDPLKSRLDRLKSLQLRKNEARKLNHEELVEEDRRSGLPSNHEARKRRAEWQVEDAKGRAEAEKSGEDYDRTQLLDVTSEDAERFHRLKMAKKKYRPRIFQLRSFESASIRAIGEKYQARFS